LQKYQSKLETLDYSLQGINVLNTCKEKIERSSLLFKISNLQQKLKENIEKNDKLKNQAFKMAITFYYIELFLSMNIFSIIFHIAHLIFNWSLKTKNSLQYEHTVRNRFKE
jgi:hypothetical protein